MKAVNSNSVLGVMHLFNNEEYYKYVIEVFSILRALVLKAGIEYIDEKGCLCYRREHPNFWIAQTANEMISYLFIDCYHYVEIGTPHWWISKHREDDIDFLNMKEAKRISSILNNEELVTNLYRLKAISEYSVNNKNTQAYHVYKVTTDLLETLVGHELLIA